MNPVREAVPTPEYCGVMYYDSSFSEIVQNKIPSGATGSVLLKQTDGSIGTNALLSVGYTGITGYVSIGGDLVPTIGNTYSLGVTGSSWKEIVVGPGTITIQGPAAGQAGFIGANLSGYVYTEKGFATPFINVGPDISANAPQGAVGGWRIGPTGPTQTNINDLVAQKIDPSGGALTGPIYSLIHPVNVVSVVTNKGYTGSTSPDLSGQYFLDNVDASFTPTSQSAKYLIYASCQVLNSANSGIHNLSASIIRSTLDMSGSSWNSSYINLANTLNNDVHYPPDTTTDSSRDLLNTSLWTTSGYNSGSGNGSANAVTINMQAIDTSFNVGFPVYYAIRVSTDTTPLLFGNIRISATNIGQS